MNSKHQKTLQALFENPVNGAIEWSRIEALLRAVGCTVVEGSGSSVTFAMGSTKAYFHRPHPQKEALRYRVKAARDFLEHIGVIP
jgi:HicA toxin of bacterial toxin-antitoxin,